MNPNAGQEGTMPTLTTERLVLEPLFGEHAKEMWPVLGDPELYHHLLAPPPESLEKLQERYEKLESRRSPDGSQAWLNWIVRVPGGPAMGFVQATLIGSDAWIGYVFGKAFWGKGYALESNARMLECLEETYGVQRFLASADRENQASIRLLERLGLPKASAEEAAKHEYPDCDDLFLGVPSRKKPVT